jgi:hypothetical protein
MQESPNSESKVVKATHGSGDRPLKLGEIEIPCYVLENGMRVLSGRGMKSALAMRESRAGFLTDLQAMNSLKPYIGDGLADKLSRPISFLRPGGGRISLGYEATVIADICEVFLIARKAGALTEKQKLIAEQCEVLTRAFAKVGIIALVDEATGYQEARARDALHKILELYIAKELLPWTKRFPNEYYQELFRLRGWDYDPLSVKRPKLIGKITENVIYKRLPIGVLDEIKSRNPKTEKGYRKHRHHQLLTQEIGNPHLEKHIASVITLMRISKSWRQFDSHVKTAFPMQNEQLELGLTTIDDDDE